MEKVLFVKVRAPVASFRRPLDHNFQRTLPMPPPTTLVGIAGAALGLFDADLWAPRSKFRQLKVSVCMETSPGRARDMWTVLKIKAGRIAERSPYFRELLFFVQYVLFFGGDETFLMDLERAFRDPAYPLSLGRDDELLLVDEVALDEAHEAAPLFHGTIVPGDIRNLPQVRPILQSGAVFEPLIVETLPLSFRVDERGVRSPESLVPFSFIPYRAENQARIEVPTVPAFACRGRTFTWLTSSPSHKSGS